MPDTHYIPSLATAELIPARTTGMLKVTPMSTKNRTPNTPEELRARIAESRAFLNQRTMMPSCVESEFFRHASRRAAITKAERATGQTLDKAREDEADQHLKTLEKAPVVTLGDVAAVLDMHRREAREHKATTRRDRLRARLLNSASETVEAFRDALVWCHPFNEPPAYNIHPRAARLMAAEEARVKEARDDAENQKVKTDCAEFAALMGQIGKEGQEYVVTLLALQNVSTLSGRALAHFVHDEDRGFIARGIRRQLAEFTRAITEDPSPADPRALLSSHTAPAMDRGTADADLLAAWEGYIQACRDFDKASATLPGGGSDEDHAPYYRAMEVHEIIIEEFEASTIAGFAVQLRYLFAKHMECAGSFKAAVYGEPVSDDLAADLAGDYRDRMLWRMAQAATRAAHGQPTSAPADPVVTIYREFCEVAERYRKAGKGSYNETENQLGEYLQILYDRAAATPATSPAGIVAKLCMVAFFEGEEIQPPNSQAVMRAAVADVQRMGVLPIGSYLTKFAAGAAPAVQPDPFADTVAAFEAEAPATVETHHDAKPSALPDEPTAAMVEAASAAAGISADAFRSAYAAAVEAFKKGIAA